MNNRTTRITREAHVRSRSLRPVVLATALLSIAMVLSGCTGGSSGADSKKKEVVIALPEEPLSLDPCDSSPSKNSRVLNQNIVESLATLDPVTGAATPRLATSWSRTSPTAWTFKLRSGVKFQDGTKFDSSSVVKALDRILDPKLGCQDLQYFQPGTKATAPDPLTVVIQTADPNPILPSLMNYVQIGSPNTPANKKTTKPIGTGPYKFVSRTLTQQVTLERFNGYWGPKPAIEKAKFVYRTDATVRTSMVKAGEADIALDVPTLEAKATGKVVPERYSQNQAFFLRLNTTIPPLNDIRVREAVAHAINNKSIVTSLMGKGGAPASQILTNLNNGFIPNYTAPAYDPAKSKQLIAAAKGAGVAVNTPISFANRPTFFAGEGELAQAIVQALESVGLNVKLKNLEDSAWQKYLDKPFPNPPAGITPVAHDNLTGDASFTFLRYIDGAGRNSTIDDPQINSTLKKAGVAEGKQRASLYQEAAKRAYSDDYVMVPIATTFGLILRSNRVDYTPNGLTTAVIPIASIKIK